MISVSAMTRAQQFGEGSFPVIVKSLGQRGSAPRQIRLKDTVTGSIMVEYSYPCPYTGETKFDTIWTCTNCSRMDELSLRNIKSKMVSHGYLEVTGLRGGISYEVKTRAIVNNCEDG